jgi:flagellin
MALTILNNLSALTAQNSLSNTQMNLQKTLTELSTGLKINSGSDDAAGLSIANGMQANMAALTQSQQNATNGVGLLQTADGALSQVTTLLNRAVTLATEASSSGLSTGVNSQSSALDNEFQSILTEISQIGNTTNFNGENVFSSSSPTSFSSSVTGLTTATALTAGSKTTITDAATGSTYVYTAQAGDTIADLQTAITNAATDGTLSAGTTASITGGKLVIGPNTGATGIQVSTNDTALGSMEPPAGSSNTNIVFISDGTTTGPTNTTISTTIQQLSAGSLSLTSLSLSTTSGAQSALTAITSALSQVSAQRGQIGASVNRLQAATAVMSTQVQNLQSATNSIEDADIGKTVAQMTQFNILQSTGMAALQQANSASQNVLKLLQ